MKKHSLSRRHIGITRMQNHKELSIITVNYRSENYLKKCLASIYNFSDRERIEIIIVNNDEKFETSFFENNYPEARIINHRKNIGFGAGCNLGAKNVQGEFLLFLNPDTQFLDDYVGKIMDKFAKSPEKIGIIGPRLITDEGKTQQWCAGKTITLWQIIKNNIGLVENKKIWESPEDIYTDWVSGAALAIKKEAFEKIGGFDENFFMYFEDDDLCRRAKRAGYEILYSPEETILHSGGKSYGNTFRKKAQFYKSLAYYLQKKLKGL